VLRVEDRRVTALSDEAGSRTLDLDVVVQHALLTEEGSGRAAVGAPQRPTRGTSQTGLGR